MRIELGEIEAALNHHPAIHQAVVLAQQDQSGEKRLIAYVVRQTGQRFTADELRASLKEMLPDYMLPAIFIFLERFPLTASCKVDRRTLPSPQGLRPDLEQAFVAPRSIVEKTLASIWAEALDVQQVGIYDNFFSLGGDSILSIQVITHARQAGFPLTTKHLFQHQTIAQLASLL
jgi:aryl carrier-like protein